MSITLLSGRCGDSLSCDFPAALSRFSVVPAELHRYRFDRFQSVLPDMGG